MNGYYQLNENIKKARRLSKSNKKEDKEALEILERQIKEFVFGKLGEDGYKYKIIYEG